MRPTSQYLTNYVALLCIEVGHPCSTWTCFQNYYFEVSPNKIGTASLQPRREDSVTFITQIDIGGPNAWPPMQTDLAPFDVILRLCDELGLPDRKQRLSAIGNPHRRSCGHGIPYHGSKHVDRGWISPGYLSCHQGCYYLNLVRHVLSEKVLRNVFLAPVGRVYNQAVRRAGELSRYNFWILTIWGFPVLSFESDSCVHPSCYPVNWLLFPWNYKTTIVKYIYNQQDAQFFFCY